MNLIYVIVVFNFFHQQQAILPGTYPDMASCQVALVQQQFASGYWGKCQVYGYAPQHRRLK